jgi:hypothetical protein
MWEWMEWARKTRCVEQHSDRPSLPMRALAESTRRRAAAWPQAGRACLVDSYRRRDASALIAVAWSDCLTGAGTLAWRERTAMRAAESLTRAAE